MSRSRRRRRSVVHARRALTLLEIVLAMGLLVVVSSMTYWFYSTSLETSRKGTEAAQKLRLARVLLDRIAMEIRQASTKTVDNRVGIRGGPERIWLSSHRVPSREQSLERRTREKPPPGEYDLTKVEYKIVRHPEVRHPEDDYEYPLGLARVEILVPRPEKPRVSEESDEGEADAGYPTDGGDTTGAQSGRELSSDDDENEEERGDASLGLDIRWDELYAPEIRYLRFCYYDGHKWWDSWEIAGQNPLPQLVLVTIGFDPRPPFGEETGLEEVNEEFCTCLNEDPVECEPLAEDQFSTVVRVPQSDPMFRSRISRETQGFMEELAGGLAP